MIIDVRSPGEFQRGHIPSSVNHPLFSDRERHIIGLCYKEQGPNAALDLGLGYALDKLDHLIEYQDEVEVVCARGGMRSEAVTALLNFCDIPATQYAGGYKAYRQKIVAQFSSPHQLCILGGMTGSGKTELLHEMARQGHQIIDLEHLAHHKGSAFGFLGTQPTQEQFENQLGEALLKSDGPIWVEDESRLIGSLHIPAPFFDQMRQSPLHFIECDLEDRVTRLIKHYSSKEPKRLVKATRQLSKRLGLTKTQQAINAYSNGDVAQAVRLVLSYYDKAYTHALTKRRGPVRPLLA